MRGEVALSWSGGKDCAAALWRLRRDGVEPAALLTTVDEDTGAVAHHGVPPHLLRRQAAALGIPLVAVGVPRGAGNAVYEQRLRDAFARPPLCDVAAVAFGDLFLADIRRYREQRMAEAGLAAVFPLWAADTGRLAREVLDAGFEATVVSVDRQAVGLDLLGRRFDAALLEDLPAGVDPCGERGEFHTFTHGGPVFTAPVGFELGAVTSTERFGWIALD
jgi:uncharacterized protein (TIGR00290 family)